MIKKHTIAAVAVLAFGVITKLFLLDSKASNQEVSKPILADTKPKIEITPEVESRELQFANEEIPIGNKRITWRMNKALKAHAHSTLRTNKLHQKAAQWFPVIEPILKAYGIPEDFKYMPLVESGLTGNQKSSKGAGGYWQFMPQTARDFNLKVNGKVDERYALRKSTVAAAKYLKALFKEFNSWTLVAAAYNVGEGSLKNRIQAQNQDNYFKLKLNKETGSYVYKLISMKEIIENPKKYGYKEPKRKLLAYTK